MDSIGRKGKELKGSPGGPDLARGSTGPAAVRQKGIAIPGLWLDRPPGLEGASEAAIFF